jgi:rubrerythrin
MTMTEEQEIENAEIIRLLKKIAGEERLTALELKQMLTPDEFDLACKVKVKQHDLSELVQTLAEREGLSEDEYIEKEMKKRTKAEEQAIAKRLEKIARVERHERNKRSLELAKKQLIAKGEYRELEGDSK